MSETGYLLANRTDTAAVRLEALAALFDPWTFRHLEARGLAEGWRCWEVGAGGPSVARWIAGKVGPGGRVVATDLDVSRIAPAAGLEVLRHDVARDPAPPGPFELIHARLVLVHVAERAAALASMIGALRPGGWLVIEDADPALQPLLCLEDATPEHALANRLRRGFRELLVERGAELAFGRTLPRLLREAGLAEVGADAYFPIAHPALAPLERATIEHVAPQLIATGRATADDIARHLAAVDAGRLDLATSPLCSAWGRRV
ncbi:MAG TPA: methyltransferase domain-containing protein [Kofleriaceae bacterium]|nr:methyltransferase domain-containing protein [Kofleriaceae bacterium]